MKDFWGLKLVTFLVLGICAFLILGVECEDDDASVMLVLKKSLNSSKKTGMLNVANFACSDVCMSAYIVEFESGHFCRGAGNVLYDHRPLQLNEDDHQYVCQIFKRKGLDWSSDKKVEWDPDEKRVLLPLGKPLVPEYAMRFVGGSSAK
ncbi:hypothetical protein FXO38_15922 [Capsicum annuum]|nr:hypothetical protein FXO38_15922 [Capsicum annuum]